LALVSPDGMAPGRMVSVLISPCIIKSRSSLLAPAHPGWSWKRAVNGCGDCVVVTNLPNSSLCEPSKGPFSGGVPYEVQKDL